MAIRLPTFNVLLSFWNAGHTPAADPPDFTDVPAQVYLPSRGVLDITPSAPDTWVPPVYLRIPLGSHTPDKNDIAAVQPGLTDCYKVRWVQNAHIGFPNEYQAVLVEQCTVSGATPR